MSAPLSWPNPPWSGRSALHCLKHFLAQGGGRIRDPDARRPHGVDLELGGVLTAGDHGAGMAHATARRSGAAGDEADHGLAGLGFPDELRALDLGVAADLADHDDALGLGIGDEHLQALDEVGAVHRIAADADAGGLAQTHGRGLRHRLVGERSRALDDADLAALVDVARYD